MKKYIVQTDANTIELVQAPIDEIVDYYYPGCARVEVLNFDYFSQFKEELWLSPLNLTNSEYIEELHEWLTSHGFVFKINDGYDGGDTGYFVYKAWRGEDKVYVVIDGDDYECFETSNILALKLYLTTRGEEESE